MTLQLHTAPKDSPIDLEDLRDHLRATDDDTEISALLDTAVAHFDGPQGVLGRALMPQTWTMFIDGWGYSIEIPLAPLRSIVSVRYLDPAGAEQTLDAGEYFTLGNDPARLFFDGAKPSLRQRPGCIRIQFECGYDEVPADLASLIKLYAGWLYDDRESEPWPAIQALTAKYKVNHLA